MQSGRWVWQADGTGQRLQKACKSKGTFIPFHDETEYFVGPHNHFGARPSSSESLRRKAPETFLPLIDKTTLFACSRVTAFEVLLAVAGSFSYQSATLYSLYKPAGRH